jgi:hypothetical protein
MRARRFQASSRNGLPVTSMAVLPLLSKLMLAPTACVTSFCWLCVATSVVVDGPAVPRRGHQEPPGRQETATPLSRKVWSTGPATFVALRAEIQIAVPGNTDRRSWAWLRPGRAGTSRTWTPVRPCRAPHRSGSVNLTLHGTGPRKEAVAHAYRAEAATSIVPESGCLDRGSRKTAAFVWRVCSGLTGRHRAVAEPERPTAPSLPPWHAVCSAFPAPRSEPSPEEWSRTK